MSCPNCKKITPLKSGDKIRFSGQLMLEQQTSNISEEAKLVLIIVKDAIEIKYGKKIKDMILTNHKLLWEDFKKDPKNQTKSNPAMAMGKKLYNTIVNDKVLYLDVIMEYKNRGLAGTPEWEKILLEPFIVKLVLECIKAHAKTTSLMVGPAGVPGETVLALAKQYNKLGEKYNKALKKAQSSKGAKLGVRKPPTDRYDPAPWLGAGGKLQENKESVGKNLQLQILKEQPIPRVSTPGPILSRSLARKPGFRGDPPGSETVYNVVRAIIRSVRGDAPEPIESDKCKEYDKNWAIVPAARRPDGAKRSGVLCCPKGDYKIGFGAAGDKCYPNDEGQWKRCYSKNKFGQRAWNNKCGSSKRLHTPFELGFQIQEGLNDRLALHLMLDIIGFVEPFGVADMLNALMYLEEDEMFLAGVSVIAALIPYWGDVGKVFKFVKNGPKMAAEEIATHLVRNPTSHKKLVDGLKATLGSDLVQKSPHIKRRLSEIITAFSLKNADAIAAIFKKAPSSLVKPGRRLQGVSDFAWKFIVRQIERGATKRMIAIQILFFLGAFHTNAGLSVIFSSFSAVSEVIQWITGITTRQEADLVLAKFEYPCADHTARPGTPQCEPQSEAKKILAKQIRNAFKRVETSAAAGTKVKLVRESKRKNIYITEAGGKKAAARAAAKATAEVLEVLPKKALDDIEKEYLKIATKNFEGIRADKVMRAAPEGTGAHGMYRTAEEVAAPVFQKIARNVVKNIDEQLENIAKRRAAIGERAAMAKRELAGLEAGTPSSGIGKFASEAEKNAAVGAKQAEMAPLMNQKRALDDVFEDLTKKRKTVVEEYGLETRATKMAAQAVKIVGRIEKTKIWRFWGRWVALSAGCYSAGIAGSAAAITVGMVNFVKYLGFSIVGQGLMMAGAYVTFRGISNFFTHRLAHEVSVMNEKRKAGLAPGKWATIWKKYLTSKEGWKTMGKYAFAFKVCSAAFAAAVSRSIDVSSGPLIDQYNVYVENREWYPDDEDAKKFAQAAAHKRKNMSFEFWIMAMAPLSTVVANLPSSWRHLLDSSGKNWLKNLEGSTYRYFTDNITIAQIGALMFATTSDIVAAAWHEEENAGKQAALATQAFNAARRSFIVEQLVQMIPHEVTAFFEGLSQHYDNWYKQNETIINNEGVGVVITCQLFPNTRNPMSRYILEQISNQAYNIIDNEAGRNAFLDTLLGKGKGNQKAREAAFEWLKYAATVTANAENHEKICKRLAQTIKRAKAGKAATKPFYKGPVEQPNIEKGKTVRPRIFKGPVATARKDN